MPDSSRTHFQSTIPSATTPPDWDLVRLGDLLEGIDAGKSPSLDDIPASTGEWGVLKVSAVKPGGFISAENKVVRDSIHVNIDYEVHDGDLLMTRANTSALVGQMCLVRNPQARLMLCDKTLRLRLGNRALPQFIFYLAQINYFRLQVEVCATGSSGSMKNISQGEIRKLLIAIPRIQEQKRIAEILDTLDEAICKTEQVIAKLQKMKQGLLHDLLTRGTDENGELRDPERHPEQFKDSPLGRIPRGWEVRHVGELFDMQLGKMLSKSASTGPSQFKYIANRHVQWDAVVLDDLDSMSFSHSERERYNLLNGDILVCEGGEVGRTALWSYQQSEIYFQKAIHRLRPKQCQVDPRFMLAFMRLAAERGMFSDLSSQTSIAHLTQEKLARLKTLVPPTEEQASIGDLLDAAGDKVASELFESAKLHTLYPFRGRDCL